MVANFKRVFIAIHIHKCFDSRHRGLFKEVFFFFLVDVSLVEILDEFITWKSSNCYLF